MKIVSQMDLNFATPEYDTYFYGGDDCGTVLSSFKFVIDNYLHITSAYGEAVAALVVDRLGNLLRALVEDDGVVTPKPNGTVEIRLERLAALGPGPIEMRSQAWVERACHALGQVAIETSRGVLHLVLSGSWSIERASASGRSPKTSRGRTPGIFMGVPAEDGSAWAERYRADMTRVVGLMRLLQGSQWGRGRIELHWQPVRDAQDSQSVLYWEALARFVDETGVVRDPRAEIEALERIGLMRAFDHHIVGLVVAELESDPDVVLAANISAASAVFDEGWSVIEARLAATPGAGRRLVLEITETSPMRDVSSVVRFAARMRKLGCRIALDEFGLGHASIRRLIAISPEIVKVDKFFLRRACLDARHDATFKSVTQLAKALGASVVCEGVEDARQAEAAQDAGVDWQQGFFWGRPSISRMWRTPFTVPGGSMPVPGARSSSDAPAHRWEV